MGARVKLIGMMAGLMLFAGRATATPGGVDAAGCHDSAKIGRHCHPQRATGSGGADGSKKDRDKRLKKECRGAVNAGACLGYTGKR